jgi:hypothetical protein
MNLKICAYFLKIVFQLFNIIVYYYYLKFCQNVVIMIEFCSSVTNCQDPQVQYDKKIKLHYNGQFLISVPTHGMNNIIGICFVAEHSGVLSCSLLYNKHLRY